MGEKGIVRTYHPDFIVSSVACMESVQGVSNSVGKFLLCHVWVVIFVSICKGENFC